MLMLKKLPRRSCKPNLMDPLSKSRSMNKERAYNDVAPLRSVDKVCALMAIDLSAIDTSALKARVAQMRRFL